MTQTASHQIKDNQPLSNLPSTEPPSKKPKKFNPRLLIPVGLAIGGISYGIWTILPKPPETILRVSGRLEVDEVDIGAKTAGRITAILVREGDQTKKGQLVVQMEDEEIPAQLSGLNAQIESARQEELQAKQDIAVADSRIKEANLNVKQAQEDTVGRVSQAQSNVAAAEADLAQIEAQVKQAEAEVEQYKSQLRLAQLERDRYASLVSEGAVTQQQFDEKQTTLDTTNTSLASAVAKVIATQASVKAAQERLTAAKGNAIQVQSTGLNPEIRNAQLDAYYQQKTQAESRLLASQSKVKNAQAARDQIQRRLESFDVKSPIDGIVQSRPLEPGAVVATGKTLLTVLDPNAVYMRAYIPEGDLGKIRVGQTGRVFLDSSSKHPYHAHISQIDTKASFTPENIYFKQDRVKQVFGIKLAIDQPEGFAKPGMPVDAEIDLTN